MPEDKTSRNGGCACGHARYRMTSEPMFVHCCHCRYCQRETGTSFALNALIEADRVQVLEGEVVGITIPSASGAGQKLARCPKCFVTLWSNYSMDGGISDAVRFIRVGTLDEPDRLPPDIHIYTSTKQPWVILPAGTPSVAEYYKGKEMWPEDSLKRRAALLGRA